MNSKNSYSEDPDWKKKSKEALNKSREKLRQIGDTISGSLEDQSNELFYSAFAYVPVIGPAVGWLFKRKLKLVYLHSGHAAYLQLSFTAIWLAVWLLENLPLVSGLLRLIRFVPNMTNAVLYLDVVVFLFLSIFSAAKANSGSTWVTPHFFGILNGYLGFWRDNDSTGLTKR